MGLKLFSKMIVNQSPKSLNHAIYNSEGAFELKR